MGRADLIGSGKHQLIPRGSRVGTGTTPEGNRKAVAKKTQQSKPFRTQHTGLKGVKLPQRKPRKS